MNAANAARFTGWSALVGGLLAYANVALYFAVCGGDTNMIFHGPTMLSLAPETRELFRLSMLCDVTGFYLPLLVIGAYLWNAFRAEAGALGDLAALAIVVYVIVGVSGAVIQMAALNPLAQLHAGGDESVMGATEAAWTAIVNGSQKGLWWVEGPVFLFWAFAVGNRLKAANWGQSLLLRIVGILYGLFFVFGYFADLGEITDLLETAVVLILPLWMLLIGWQVVLRAVQVQK